MRTAWRVSELDEQATMFVKFRAMDKKAPAVWLDAIDKQSPSIQKKFWALVDAKDAARVAEMF
jgi:hypothetical protein